MVSKGHQRVGGVICPAHTISDGDSVTGCDPTQPLAWSSEAILSILLKHLGETWGVQSVTPEVGPKGICLQICPNI